MCDEKDGEIAFDVQPLKDAHHLDARPAIEIPCRFIGEEQDGIAHQRAGYGDALLLSPGHLTPFVVHPIRQTDRLQRRHRAAPAYRGRNSLGIQQRQLHIVDGGRSRQQVEPLKDEADFMIAHGGELIPREP